jgi:hypothetical protein
MVKSWKPPFHPSPPNPLLTPPPPPAPPNAHPSRGIFPSSKNYFEGQDHIKNPSCKPFLGTLKSHLEVFGQIHTVFGGILTKHKNLQPIVIPFFKNAPCLLRFLMIPVGCLLGITERKKSTPKNHRFVSHVIASATCITRMRDHTSPQALSTHKYLLHYL